MASGQATPVEPLQHKTITLKTSIHCPGCSRKVKRIIQSIPGVHNFAIDPSQNKVSITGDAEADVIIKKFLKSNKQVALWPEEKEPTAANTTTSSKEISTSNDLSEKKKKPDATAAADDKKTVDVAQEAASKPDVGPEKSPNENGPKSQRESVVPGKDDSNNKSENQEAKGSGDGDGDEKKEKIVRREISSGDRAVVDASDAEGMASLPPPQQQQQQQITMHHQTPTAAAYVMSYNMAQPSTAHSYYAFPPPPPLPSQGHFYSSYTPPPPPPPPEFYYGMPSEWGSPAPPPESYHMFNDENANSCNVM